MKAAWADVAELAAAFDRTFAEAVHARAAEHKATALAVRIGGEPYLLRLEDLASVAKRPKIVPLPGAPPAQVGLAGHRGSLVAVFSLPALLGYEVPPERLSWLTLGPGARPIAFAFDDLEGQVVIERHDVVVGAGGDRPWISGLVPPRAGDPARAIVDLAAITLHLRGPR